MCDIANDEKPHRYYAIEPDFVIIESPITYTPTLISAHGKIKANMVWYQALKVVASKVYGEDYSLASRRCGSHFVIEVASVHRTRDTMFTP